MYPEQGRGRSSAARVRLAGVGSAGGVRPATSNSVFAAGRPGGESSAAALRGGTITSRLNATSTLPGEQILASAAMSRGPDPASEVPAGRVQRCVGPGRWNRLGGVGEGRRGVTMASAGNTRGEYGRWSFMSAAPDMANIVTSAQWPGDPRWRYYRLGRPDDRGGHHLRGGQRDLVLDTDSFYRRPIRSC